MSTEQDKFATELARDLTAHRGKSLLLAGDGQPPAVHALVHALNHKFGNVGETVFYSQPLLPDQQADSARHLAQLTTALRERQVDPLLILGGNPAYTAPSDVAFAEVLRDQLANRGTDDWLAICCSPYNDETGRLCHWHVPQSHFLEAWSDAVAFDGT